MRCPTCNSRDPELHPATADGGEAVICRDGYHGEARCNYCGRRLSECLAIPCGSIRANPSLREAESD